MKNWANDNEGVHTSIPPVSTTSPLDSGPFIRILQAGFNYKNIQNDRVNHGKKRTLDTNGLESNKHDSNPGDFECAIRDLKAITNKMTPNLEYNDQFSKLPKIRPSQRQKAQEDKQLHENWQETLEDCQRSEGNIKSSKKSTHGGHKYKQVVKPSSL